MTELMIMTDILQKQYNLNIKIDKLMLVMEIAKTIAQQVTPNGIRMENTGSNDPIYSGTQHFTPSKRNVMRPMTLHADMTSFESSRIVTTYTYQDDHFVNTNILLRFTQSSR